MSEHPRPNMVDTKDGPVDLGMLVGALLRSTEVMLMINDRRQRKRGQFLPADYNGPRFGRPPGE